MLKKYLMNYHLLLLQSNHGHHGFLVNAHYVTPITLVWSILTMEAWRHMVGVCDDSTPTSFRYSIDSILSNEYKCLSPFLSICVEFMLSFFAMNPCSYKH